MKRENGITFRPFEFTDEDYQALSDIRNAVFPDMLITPEETKFRDETREKKYLYIRFLGRFEGGPIAYLIIQDTYWSYRPGKLYFNYFLLPEHWGKGFEAVIYDFLMDKLAGHNPNHLVTEARENEKEKIDLWQTRGFKRGMRYPYSHLDVSEFDPAPFEKYVDGVLAAGIEIVTAAELQERDPDWLRKWSDLDWEVLQDVPHPDHQLTRKPVEYYQKIPESPNYLPDGMFFALDGDQPVGITGFWSSAADKTLLVTWRTGVARSHRRRGIATALKLRSIEFAREYGATRIETDNEENNPMYQLNLRLGFKPAPAFMDFEKKLEGP